MIDGVIWKGQAAALAFRPQDGVEVIATGRLTTYPGRSKYQIVIERMELAGAGALMALLEKLQGEARRPRGCSIARASSRCRSCRA